jgi:hypothetical protein
MELLYHHCDFLNGDSGKRMVLGAVSFENWLRGSVFFLPGGVNIPNNAVRVL